MSREVVTQTQQPTSHPLTSGGILQRQCGECGQHAIAGGECTKCQKKRLPLQRHTTDRSELSEVPPIVYEGLNSPSQPLDPETRIFMESRFKRDLSNVRVHTDPTAAQSTQALAAAAFTVGQDIVFGTGQYLPGSLEGRLLIAHELAHSIQQDMSRVSPSVSLTMSRPGDRFEREASLASRQVLSHSPMPQLSQTGLVLQRGFGDDQPAIRLRSNGLTEAEWAKIKQVRKFFNLPDRPTQSTQTIVGILITPDGKEIPLKSGEEGGPFGGTQRGGIPRGKGEAFTGGGPSQGNIATHVEGHAAAKMHELGLSEATLLIEEAPCKVCDRNVTTALPPGAKIAIIDPETAGHYRSSQLGSRIPLKPPSEPESSSGAKPKGLNPSPEPAKVPPLEDPHLPKGLGTTKVPEKLTPPKLSPQSSGGVRGRVGPRVLRGAGNIALDLSLLVATVVWELVVAPKLEAVQRQLEQFKLELEAGRRDRLEAQIQKKFDVYEAKHIGRIVKSCYLKQLKAIEQSGKTAYVNVSLNISFEDTSGRFQLFKETPPESYFDMELNDINLVSVLVGNKPVDSAVGPLTRCENCGTLGRDKSFMGNNPLWEQTVSFSFEAPKSDEIAKEFEKEPETGDCLANIACFIATACYGSPLAPEVQVLRNFRDRRLLTHRLGRLFVRMYYFVSPPIAFWLGQHPGQRRLVRNQFVAPLVRLVQWLDWED